MQEEEDLVEDVHCEEKHGKENEAGDAESADESNEETDESDDHAEDESGGDKDNDSHEVDMQGLLSEVSTSLRATSVTALAVPPSSKANMKNMMFLYVAADQ